LTNSKALELANLTKDSIDPKDGAIERNPETGEPTGILRGTATDLVWNAVPEPNEQEMVEAAKEAVNKIVEAGITTAHWIVSSATELSVAQKLITENNLDLRIFIITTASVFGQLLIPEPPEQPTKNVSKIGGVLIFEDGYLAAQTAALNEPYMGSSTDKGKLLYTEEELYNLAAKVHKANLQVIIHAMGDKAVNVALKTFEAISRGQSTGKNRHRLEQAALLSKQLVQQIKKQEITVSIQPKVVESEFSAWSAIEHLGKERARMLFPIKTLLKNGICVVGGSDCPMEPLSPISGIHAATTRKYFRNEKLTVEEALRIYTVNAAYATFEENEKGAIEQGKLADLTVLSGDPTSTSIDMLSDIEVEMTIIGGRIAFQKIRS
jgi:predicted amidohydrolase YtcJ